MSRGKKSGKKNVAKRGATPVKNLDKTKEKAHKEQKPSRDTDEVLRITASRWGTILALLFVALLTSLNWVSKPERCGTYSKFAPVWHLLEQYGIAKTPSDAVLKEACARVQSITHSCLFLSGRKDNVTGKLQNGLTQLWDHFSGLFDVGAGSHVPLESEVLYERHPRDLLFALTWGVILLALRGVLMQLLFLPAARLLVQKPAQEKWALPRHRRKYLRSVDRFAEQFWIAVLYGTSLMLVLVRIVSYPKCAARRQPFWPYNPEDLWHGYPHTTMDGLTKAVYLWEASNYIHQLFVLNIEARRSDYAQMGVHHLITLALIGGSYVCCFWRVGLVILLLMDPSDVLLAMAKMLKYMGLQTICDAMFGAFMLSWTFTRHIGYMIVMKTCIYDAPRLIPYHSPVDLVSGHVFTPTTYVIFIVLLVILQGILLIWFGMILKVTYRVLTSAGAIDSRSDDDDSE